MRAQPGMKDPTPPAAWAGLQDTEMRLLIIAMPASPWPGAAELGDRREVVGFSGCQLFGENGISQGVMTSGTS